MAAPTLRRILLASLVALAIVPTTASADASLAGTWSCCGAGGAGGQTWTLRGDGKGDGSGNGLSWPMTWSNAGGAVTIVTGPYRTLPAYTATFTGTLSADGKTITGTWSDTYGQHGEFTATGSLQAEGTHIKGRVTDSFNEGVDNVRVIANGKGGRKQSITSDGGYYDIKLSDIKKAATYNVSASNKLYRFIDPKIHKVTVKPGGTGYAAFTVATGKLRGTVRELDCVRTLAPAPDCHARKVATAAVVELRGDQVGRKYANVQPDGSFEFKVPIGKYDLRVNRLDTSASGGEDVCKENPGIPAKGDDEVDCDKVVDVEAKKGATKTTDFVGVPRIIVPTLRLLTFDRINKPHEATSILSGLGDPEDPELFGSYGSGSGKDDFPVLRCKAGCATIEATARNLLGKSIEGARFKGISANPVDLPLGVTPGNEHGIACFTPRRAPDRERRDCLREERTDDNGRALGMYAAPGIVSGAITQQADGPVHSYVQATATARGYSDAPVSAGPLFIRTNERVGTRRTATVVLTQKDADVLNVITDPNTTKQGLVHVVRTIPEGCGKVTQWFFGKRVPIISHLCDALESPATLSKPALEQYVDLVGASFLMRRLGIRSEGLIASFHANPIADEVATGANDLLDRFIPSTTTPAARFLSDYLKEWRKAQGEDHFDANGKLVREPIKAGQRIVLRMFEVSHFALDQGDLVRTPAVLLSLQADLMYTPQTLIVTGRQGYDPLRWLT
jgi:hypothetical protein